MKKHIITASFVAACFSAVVTGCNKNSDQPSDTVATNQVSSYGTNSVTTNTDVKADNTKLNERDRNKTNLTALDQGNSADDIKVSAAIRQKVVSSTNNFSTLAKNVKIITQNGKVTLRGPVNTDAEKMQVESIAKEVAGDGNVENALEVKTN